MHLNLWRQPQSPALADNFEAEVTIKKFQYESLVSARRHSHRSR